jgi:hypothetical protein
LKTILGWVLVVLAVIGIGVGVEAGLGPGGGVGTVTGFIEPCEGLPIPAAPYAAGTVTAIQGEQTYRQIAPGAYQMVLPTTIVARQRVGRNQRFDLDLSPGHYVLVAKYDGPGNASSFLDVQITVGTTFEVNMPNLCS